MTACSRWLSEGRATPPDCTVGDHRTLAGVPAADLRRVNRCQHPAPFATRCDHRCGRGVSCRRARCAVVWCTHPFQRKELNEPAAMTIRSQAARLSACGPGQKPRRVRLGAARRPPLLEIAPVSRFRRNELNTARVAASMLRRISVQCATVARILTRAPPFQALRAERALPSSVRGPVEWFQGHRARIRSACFRRVSGVQRGMMS